MNWSTFFAGLGNLGASIATDVQTSGMPIAVPGAPGTLYIPGTGQVVTTNSLNFQAGGGSMLFLILILVVVVFALRK